MYKNTLVLKINSYRYLNCFFKRYLQYSQFILKYISNIIRKELVIIVIFNFDSLNSFIEVNNPIRSTKFVK